MKREPVKYSNVWSCPNCPGNPDFQHAEFLTHLTDVHKITDRKGSKQMMLHLDASDHHTSAYEWTIGGLKFSQCVIRPRETMTQRRERLKGS